MKPSVFRYLEPWMHEDLSEKKMVFIGGPRQVGKTSLALALVGAEDERDPRYYNWDEIRARDQLLKGSLNPARELVLDEIHKYPRWKSLVKGYYDTRKSRTRIIVTGSARLDLYKQGGDSLQGRYHHYRLHPFTLGEIALTGKHGDLAHLLEFGGFPEPFTKGNARHWRRWQLERRDRLVREDLRDLERVRELSFIDLLVAALPERVGSPLSVKNLRDALQVAHESVERWISILERLYFCFRISPYGPARVKAVKKEKKLYLWDWSLVPEPGPRFENFVASHLLKYCHFEQDVNGHEMELRYLRNVEKREIDFVVLRDGKAEFAVECKSGEKSVSPALRYFSERVKIPQLFQVHLGTREFIDASSGVHVLPFESFSKLMRLP